MTGFIGHGCLRDHFASDASLRLALGEAVAIAGSRAQMAGAFGIDGVLVGVKSANQALAVAVAFAGEQLDLNRREMFGAKSLRSREPVLPFATTMVRDPPIHAQHIQRVHGVKGSPLLDFIAEAHFPIELVPYVTKDWV